MLRATHMLAVALGAIAHDGADNQCGLCGAIGPARPWRDVVKPTFTNIDELRAATICWACAACLDDPRTRSSLVVDARGYRRLVRRDIWPLLISPPEPPFVVYLTISGKKHGVFRQSVATRRDHFRLQCEAMAAYYNRQRDVPRMRLCAELVLAGVSRSSVETGHYDSADYRAAGIATIRAAERTLGPWRPTTLFAILYGLMPGKKDLPEINYGC